MVSKKANSTVKVTAAKAEEKAAVKEAVGAKAVKAEEKAAKTPVAKPENKPDKKETEAAKAIETKKDSTMKLETKAAVLVDTPEVQTEETAGYKIATADEIKALADEGIFLHYDSIKRVFEE